MAKCAWPQTAWSDPDAEQLAHYGNDPRGRSIVLLRDRAGATIGAGSVISKDAAAGELTVARAKQTTIAGWKRPAKKS